MSGKVAIIAGNGVLPVALSARLKEQGKTPYLVGFRGNTPAETLEPYTHLWARLGGPGRIFRWLRKHGVTDVVFSGGLKRPNLWSICPDFTALAFIIKAGRKAMGDNSLLEMVGKMFADHGFVLHGAHEFMSEFLMPEAVLGSVQPNAQDLADIAYGKRCALAIGALDIGQCVIVENGLVLGVEGVEGTDALIARCKDLKRTAQGGVLVKMCKPQQNKKLDMPSIGPETVRNVKANGLRGIAIHAGQSLCLEPEKTIALADKEGVFLVGISDA